MAGAKITLDLNCQAAEAKLQQVMAVMHQPQALLQDWGEVLVESTQARFTSQTGPDGKIWQALSPRYARRKKRHQDKALVLDGYLRDLLRYQISGNELQVGSDRKYAAIHQLGGEIDIAARSQQLYFRQNKAGDVSRLFVKKNKSNFAQWATIGNYRIKIPARPFLGVSTNDEAKLLQKAEDRLLGKNS